MKHVIGWMGWVQFDQCRAILGQGIDAPPKSFTHPPLPSDIGGVEWASIFPLGTQPVAGTHQQMGTNN